MIERFACCSICPMRSGLDVVVLHFAFPWPVLVPSTFTTGHSYHLGRGKIESVNVVDGHYRRMSALLLNPCTSHELWPGFVMQLPGAT